MENIVIAYQIDPKEKAQKKLTQIPEENAVKNQQEILKEGVLIWLVYKKIK